MNYKIAKDNSSMCTVDSSEATLPSQLSSAFFVPSTSHARALTRGTDKLRGVRF